MKEQNTLQQQIMARAMKDEAFRQELLANPKAVLERELGITLPRGVSVQVHEDTATILHLVLPMKPPAGESQELSDAELEQAADSMQGAAPVTPRCSSATAYCC